MRKRRMILVIAVYVGLDLTNPFMPGAFIFDPEQSAEGVHAERGRAPLAVLAAPAAPRVPADETLPAPRRPVPAVRKWFAEPPTARLPASDPPPLAEDH
jgi:hypothetical protein